jgi:hypothetical protein
MTRHERAPELRRRTSPCGPNWTGKSVTSTNISDDNVKVMASKTWPVAILVSSPRRPRRAQPGARRRPRVSSKPWPGTRSAARRAQPFIVARGNLHPVQGGREHAIADQFASVCTCLGLRHNLPHIAQLGLLGRFEDANWRTPNVYHTEPGGSPALTAVLKQQS